MTCDQCVYDRDQARVVILCDPCRIARLERLLLAAVQIMARAEVISEFDPTLTELRVLVARENMTTRVTMTTTTQMVSAEPMVRAMLPPGVVLPLCQCGKRIDIIRETADGHLYLCRCCADITPAQPAP